MKTFVVLPRKGSVRFALEPLEVLFPVRHHGIMDMIRHLTHRKHPDMVLAGQYAIVREIDEVVAVSIEQDTVVVSPLVTVGQCVLVKLPTLHISQLVMGSGQNPCREYRQLFEKKQGEKREFCGLIGEALCWSRKSPSNGTA